jgi:hypothetical protein
VLQLAGVSYVQNTVNVNAGALVIGGASNYGLTQVNVGAGAILDMRGQNNLQLGSVIGAGTIKNFHAAQTAATLITGADNTDGTFSGTFVSDFSNALLSVRKMGTGNWTLSGDSSGSMLGTLTVANGTLTLAAATAKEGFQTYNFQKGATLLLDNTSNAVNFRLGSGTVATGANTTLQPQGGELVIRGNGSTAVREAVQTLTPGDGGGILTLNAAGTPGVTLALAVLGGQSATSSLLIRADSLSFGTVTGGSAAANTGALTLATMAAPAGQGGGANNTMTMSVRPDVLGDSSVTGLGSGFLTKDMTGNFLRVRPRR